MYTNDLDDIFDEYYERKKYEKEQSNAREKKEQDRIILIRKKLKENAIPVLNAILKEIQNKGHKVSMINNLDDSLNPQITIKFFPVFEGREENSNLIDSSLSFGDKIKKEIFLKDTYPIKEISGVEIENLTKNMIKSKMLEFIKEVLQAI